MTDSNELQPSQTSLEDIKEIDKIIQRLENILQTARFEPYKERTEIYTDLRMLITAKELLNILSLKVLSLNWPILSLS